MCCAPQTHHQALPATWCDKGKRESPFFTQQEENLQSTCTQARDQWSRLFLKVSRFGNSAAIKLCHSHGLLLVEILLWRTQGVFWVSICSESDNSHLLGSASTSSTQWKTRSCSLTAAKKLGRFFCGNQQWSFEMIVFASWILLTPTRAGVSPVPGCSNL